METQYTNFEPRPRRRLLKMAGKLAASEHARLDSAREAVSAEDLEVTLRTLDTIAEAMKADRATRTDLPKGRRRGHHGHGHYGRGHYGHGHYAHGHFAHGNFGAGQDDFGFEDRRSAFKTQLAFERGFAAGFDRAQTKGA